MILFHSIVYRYMIITEEYNRIHDEVGPWAPELNYIYDEMYELKEIIKRIV